MPPTTKSPPGESQPADAALTFAAIALAACALAVGVFARLKGLGAAPMAVDEYFIVRSTQNLLKHGWPAFDCGGIYSRGLLLQYPAALLDLLGVQPDTAPRFVSALSSLLGLPAAYLLGRRARGPLVGLLTVMVLAVSLWEIEMARFGRMYAPFQTVCLWYLVYFVRRTVDRDTSAEWPMIGLTLAGVLLWEGGVLLALANFLPPFLERRSLKLSRQEWLSCIKFALVLAVAYEFVAIDFRMLGGSPALPADYDADSSVDTVGSGLTGTPPLWPIVLASRLWLALALIPLAAAVIASAMLWRRRVLDLTALGLLVALLAALSHQILAALLLLLLLPLLRFSSWQQLSSKTALAAYVAIAAWAAFWLGLLLSRWTRPPGIPATKALATLVFPLISRPDVIDQLVRPWGGAAPLLGVGLALLLGATYVRVVRQDETGISVERALLSVLACLLIAACASDTPRHETRYVFFLYPVAVVLAICTLVSLTDRAGRRAPAAAVAGLLVCLGAFAMSEDFQPRHLLHIDSRASIFRLGMTPQMQAHLVVRDDTVSLAQWLRQHASAGQDTVINAYQSLDYYDPKIDFFYVDRSDFNFESYACRYGTIDRWSNRPLLQSVQALESVIASRPRTYLVTYSMRAGPLALQLARYHPRMVWSSGNLSVLALEPHRGQAARSL
jgi:hypothetical protein